MRFHLGWKSHFGVQSALYLRSHELMRNESQNGMDFISVILTEMKFKTGMRFSCEHNLLETKWISADSLDVAFKRMCVWNAILVWISYQSFWQKWNFTSGNKILCKHYPKSNAWSHIHQNIGSFWNAAETKLLLNRTCFHAGLKSHSSMSSFRLSCERTHRPKSNFEILEEIDKLQPCRVF